MKIEIEENDDVMSYRFCFVCGAQYETAQIMAVAYNIQGVRIARICHECIKAGPDGMRQRAHAYAQRLMKAAERAERVAEALDREEIQAPNYDELKERLKQVSGRY